VSTSLTLGGELYDIAARSVAQKLRLTALSACRGSLTIANLIDKTSHVDLPDMHDPGDPRNKYRACESQRQLRTLHMNWDLIGRTIAPISGDGGPGKEEYRRQLCQRWVSIWMP
jgi:hypothetical protein